MADVRRRKLTNKNDVGGRKKNTKTRSGSGRLKFLFIAAVIFSFFLLGIYMEIVPSWKTYYKHGANIIDNISLRLGLQKYVHAVVIDAGSTGSRVLAFTFYESVRDKSLKLENELFVELKPGLSSFSENPRECTKNLEELLERAKSVIPASSWSKTPLTMKATAGLRLLPKHKAEALLDESRKLFEKSGFLVSHESVSIMDGVDEGLFSWFTVNFLKDRLGGDPSNTVAALDLGGGSTQITFAPTDEKSLKETDSKFLHQIAAFHQTLDVYTHSYLGLGLMAARKDILQDGNPEHSFILRSPCINPIVSTKWSYGGIEYTVKGPEKGDYIQDGNFNEPVVNFSKCESVVRKYVGELDKPDELNRREINAFSYYYDRAVESGMIDLDQGGTATVQKYIETAKTICKVANVDQPFMCLDLTFISVLLRDGFGLAPSTQLNLQKKIDNYEISWALGAAFHILQNGV